METVMKTAMAKTHTHLWDRLGIGLSVACMIHCLALPVVLTGLATVAVAESFHLWMALAIVPVAFAAALPTYRRHRQKRVLWLLGAGVALLFAALVVEPLVGSIGENVVTVAGGVLLVAGHWKNWHASPHCHA